MSTLAQKNNKIVKKIHHFLLFDQTSEDCKSRQLKFVSQKEPFEEHMSVGVRFLDDLLHLDPVFF